MSEYIYGTDDHEGHWLTGEEIVRCRDCAKADYAEVHMFDGTRPKTWTCTRFKGFHHMVEPDGFCKWGERKRKEVDE